MTLSEPHLFCSRFPREGGEAKPRWYSDSCTPDLCFMEPLRSSNLPQFLKVLNNFECWLCRSVEVVALKVLAMTFCQYIMKMKRTQIPTENKRLKEMALVTSHYTGKVGIWFRWLTASHNSRWSTREPYWITKKLFHEMLSSQLVNFFFIVNILKCTGNIWVNILKCTGI